MGPRGSFGVPGAPSGPQGPLGYFRRYSCRTIRVILPSPAPTAGRTTKHATLGVRGFEFSVPGTKRVRILGALRPWTSEGSSFQCQADRRVRVLGAPRPWAAEGSSFPFEGPGGFEFWLHRDPGRQRVQVFRAGEPGGCKMKPRQENTLFEHLIFFRSPGRKLEPSGAWAIRALEGSQFAPHFVEGFRLFGSPRH